MLLNDPYWRSSDWVHEHLGGWLGLPLAFEWAVRGTRQDHEEWIALVNTVYALDGPYNIIKQRRLIVWAVAALGMLHRCLRLSVRQLDTLMNDVYLYPRGQHACRILPAYLRRMVKGKYLRCNGPVYYSGRNIGRVFSAGPKARDIFRTVYGVDLRRWGVQESREEHVYFVNEFLACLVRDHGVQVLNLDWYTLPADLWSLMFPNVQVDSPVYPDAVAGVLTPDGQVVRVFLEYDRATSTLGREKFKVGRYAQFLRLPQRGLLIYATEAKGRVPGLRQVVEETGSPRITCFPVDEAVAVTAAAIRFLRERGIPQDGWAEILGREWVEVKPTPTLGRRKIKKRPRPEVEPLPVPRGIDALTPRGRKGIGLRGLEYEMSLRLRKRRGFRMLPRIIIEEMKRGLLEDGELTLWPMGRLRIAEGWGKKRVKFRAFRRFLEVLNTKALDL